MEEQVKDEKGQATQMPGTAANATQIREAGLAEQEPKPKRKRKIRYPNAFVAGGYREVETDEEE